MFTIIKLGDIDKMDLSGLDVFVSILKIDRFQTDFASLKCAFAFRTPEIQPVDTEFHKKKQKKNNHLTRFKVQ